MVETIPEPDFCDPTAEAELPTHLSLSLFILSEKEGPLMQMRPLSFLILYWSLGQAPLSEVAWGGKWQG